MGLLSVIMKCVNKPVRPGMIYAKWALIAGYFHLQITLQAEGDPAASYWVGQISPMQIQISILQNWCT